MRTGRSAVRAGLWGLFPPPPATQAASVQAAGDTEGREAEAAGGMELTGAAGGRDGADSVLRRWGTGGFRKMSSTTDAAAVAGGSAPGASGGQGWKSVQRGQQG